jgi:Domain of unknown function (DUF5664)
MSLTHDYECLIACGTDSSSSCGDPQVRDRDVRSAVQLDRSVAGVSGLAGGVTLFGLGSDRKQYPVYSGVLGYFPAAIAELAHVSYVGNEQHNPGEPLHWAREKSTDQGDTALRHIMDHENDPIDSDGCYHLAKAAWRILAGLQIYLEKKGAPKAPMAR